MDCFYSADYYRRREREARSMADRAHFNDIRRIHLDMAHRYAVLADLAELQCGPPPDAHARSAPAASSPPDIPAARQPGEPPPDAGAKGPAH